MSRLSSLIHIPRYFKGRVLLDPPINAAEGTTHILFLFVDHFELAGKPPRLSEWVSKYPELARKHRDADGVFPKHTWFYALDLLREDELEQMGELVRSGLGEVELHWHHRHDTPETFVNKLRNGLAIFKNHGFMRPIQDGIMGCFGFIHGNWSLDNACGAASCGVDNEIELLKAAGCYGDFTFPALYNKAQPRMTNAIYYATEDGRAKSYDVGRPARVGMTASRGELMIFEGPLVLNLRDWRFKWHPMVENGEIGQSRSHNDPRRIDCWIRQAIGVEGKSNWVFVKVFCHGGQDYQSVLENATDGMFSYLENRYNDGDRYKLHYVTAREAYNIVRAAEDGKTGDPNFYRDYEVSHPLTR
jgi:hypothetical protein